MAIEAHTEYHVRNFKLRDDKVKKCSPGTEVAVRMSEAPIPTRMKVVTRNAVDTWCEQLEPWTGRVYRYAIVHYERGEINEVTIEGVGGFNPFARTTYRWREA